MFFKNPEYARISKRPLTASFRGRMKGKAAPQRQETVKILKELSVSKPNSFLTGGIIKKKSFIKEMRKSKVSISPFGYGEICYRDMEAFIHGCVLVKPSMDNLETFPNVFIENKTYIPVKWDLSDLKEVLININENYSDYINIAKAGQENFQNYYNNFELFYKHFDTIIKKVII